ncbi:hypothetical protein BFC17_07450 [Alteromonas lipolytica]|uniref:TonB-dependent receptor n=2 Tax=Alteromonas lipolytica TaxID=1856405 RepID=A0A1E8F9J8_9ALTE|nr:hypothetical protein BFC17_07450 [Alteromonas lipolytica]
MSWLACIAWSVALLMSASDSAWASQPTVSHPLYLKAQPLKQALKSLAERYNKAYIINVKRIDKYQSAPLSGTFSLAEALTATLHNTGLTFQLTEQGIVISALADDNVQPIIEEVAVNGIRASLNRSRQQKRQSVSLSDFIAAQDMASYPDRNLAESLQRIAGMSITREAGEGRQIVLRGLNPDFTLVTLNGMPVLANNDSPMDSRLQKHRDRSFDLNLFASDLFNEIQVIKSYSVDQPSGGLAGIAALKTSHPFDTPGLQWTLTQQAGTNQYTEDMSHRLSTMVSSTRGNWGALFSASYGRRDSQEMGANTFRWRKISPDGADITGLSPALQADWQAEQIWVPRGNRYSIWRSDMERLGIGASLEYLGNSSHITLDWLYGSLSGERRENHLYPRGYHSTPVIEGETRVTDAAINQRNELVFARYENARVGTESRYQEVATRYQQWVVNTEHQFSAALTGTGVFGVENARYDIPRSIKAYTLGTTDVSIDYRRDYHFVDMHYADSLLAADFWQMHELDSESYRSSTAFFNARYQLEYSGQPTSSWRWGLDITSFDNSLTYVDIQDILLTEWQQGTIPADIPRLAAFPLTAHPGVDWLALDPVSTFNAFNLPVTTAGLDYSQYVDPLNRTTEHNRVREQRVAGFLQYAWQSPAWQIVSGLRLETDQTTIRHHQTTAKPKLQQLNWLPALTINYRQEDTVYRFSASRNIGRPELEILATPTHYDAQHQLLWLFNPNLKPYSAYNLDVAVERYPGDTNRYALTLFGKWLDDYIVSTSHSMTVARAPLALADTVAAPTVQVVTPTNAESALLYGLEASLQFEVPLSHLVPATGAYHLGFAANVSYSRGTLRYHNDITGEALSTKQLPYLSPWLANLTVYLEGYAVSLRFSATYRDSYIARVDGNTQQDEDETGFEQSLYLDAVLAYQISDHWETRLEATNLTNEQEMQYSDASRRPYNTTVSGRNYYLGLSYRF